MADAVAEIVWRSRVTPITVISVTADPGADSFPETATFQVDPDIGRDHDRLEEQWGPRPVED